MLEAAEACFPGIVAGEHAAYWLQARCLAPVSQLPDRSMAHAS